MLLFFPGLIKPGNLPFKPEFEDNSWDGYDAVVIGWGSSDSQGKCHRFLILFTQR